MPHAAHSNVTYTIDRGVAHVEIDRAEKLNSLTREVFEDLVEVGRALKESTEVRAVVLSGRGRAFSAGLDFTEMSRLADEGTATASAAEAGVGNASPTGSAVDVGERLGSARALAQKAVHVWSLIEVPVIAGFRGPALGGGMQIALGTDIRIAGPDVQLSLMEIKWGIIPDMCGTQLLPRLVGPGMAKKLIATGEAIGAEEALRIGLVEELAEDPVARALELAADIAGKSRSALVWAKKLVDLSYEADLATGLDAEQEALASLIGTDEQRAVVTERLARMAKRSKG
ncbi:MULTISPECIES: enoyl-CoA hydratase-related protein [Brevibacterium]|uniref:Enoyl-CoA hydratase/carnithine racemase n=1 Tax=Brevibacterium antiquum CNRZ 918 TaxID=1255637 RepID=A0A2H1KL52_9MICO|nr:MULTISPECIES: enoyl-CoA hydratase-related protein [Brevibacterium]SMY00525.1 Enoyl-CoA hydratase/carnithine racemase [Brevibacterium antiquum CNRZ 918]HCG55920.1 enoyl-CoA hydratase [Brevibacterium sp.]